MSFLSRGLGSRGRPAWPKPAVIANATRERHTSPRGKCEVCAIWRGLPSEARVAATSSIARCDLDWHAMSGKDGRSSVVVALRRAASSKRATCTGRACRGRDQIDANCRERAIVASKCTDALDSVQPYIIVMGSGQTPAAWLASVKRLRQLAVHSSAATAEFPLAFFLLERSFV